MATNRTAYLKRAYSITPAEFQAMLDAQGGKCAICYKSLHNSRIEIDHDHRIAKAKGIRASIRGLLCGGRYWGCNRRLGRIDDSLWLRAAAAYIDHPPAGQILA